MTVIFCLGTGVLRHRDCVVRQYIYTYVFSVLCSIIQYIIKRWLHALQLRGSREHKSEKVVYEYTYQDHEYIIRTMNTKYERCCRLSCSKLHTRLQSVVPRHLYVAQANEIVLEHCMEALQGKMTFLGHHCT